MRVVWAIALAGATACSFTAPTNPAGDGEGPAPDAGVDAFDPGDPDVDDDGVPNADDSCPTVANPGQFDEDGDARGDECDACPQLVGGDTDGDGDGVGDGCDPRPNTPGDRLAYWNGFHVAGAGLPAGFAMIHGESQRWSVADGHLVFTRANDDWSIPAVDVGAATHTLDATFEITASYPVGALSAAAAGVTVDVAANDDDLFECQARTDNSSRELWYWNGRFLGGWSELDTAPTITPNETYRIVLRRAPDALACATTRNGTTVALADERDALGYTRAGLFARNVDVRYRYVAIYTVP